MYYYCDATFVTFYFAGRLFDSTTPPLLRAATSRHPAMLPILVAAVLLASSVFAVLMLRVAVDRTWGAQQQQEGMPMAEDGVRTST